jgi:hypothetical protein
VGQCILSMILADTPPFRAALEAAVPLQRSTSSLLARHCTPSQLASLSRELQWIENLYLMPLSTSKNAACSHASSARSSCLIQIPKTGSTSMKASLRLPFEYGDHFEAHSKILEGSNFRLQCKRLLVPVRDPYSRFITSAMTVRTHFAQLGERMSSNCSIHDHNARPLTHGMACAQRGIINSTQEFTDYAHGVLNDLEQRIRTCRLYPASWSSRKHFIEASHTFPQALFVGLAEANATLFGLNISSYQHALARAVATDLHRANATQTTDEGGEVPETSLLTLRHATMIGACGALVPIKAGSKQGLSERDEGKGQVSTAAIPDIMGTSSLSTQLRARIRQVYSDDFELLGW